MSLFPLTTEFRLSREDLARHPEQVPIVVPPTPKIAGSALIAPAQKTPAQPRQLSTLIPIGGTNERPVALPQDIALTALERVERYTCVGSLII